MNPIIPALGFRDSLEGGNDGGNSMLLNATSLMVISDEW